AYLGESSQATDAPLPVGTGISGTAVKLKRPVYAPDVTRDPRYVQNIPSTRSELAIPLMVRDQVVGVLDCQVDKPNSFDNETIDLLTLFSTQASIALQNAQLYSREQRRRKQMEADRKSTRELQSQSNLVCRLLLEKKKKSCNGTPFQDTRLHYRRLNGVY